MLSVTDKQTILRGVYELKPHLPVPLLVQPFGKWYATQDVMDDWALDLARQTQRNREQAAVHDFSLAHIKTGIGLGAIAASFGARCVWNDQSDAWIEPLIGMNPQAVSELALPDPRHSGLNEFILRRIEFMQARSEFPLQPCNIASPLTTASYLWGYSDFLAAIVEHPKAVHHLLKLVTQATIDFVRTQMRVIENLWALSHEDWYLPVEFGIRVSDDVLAVISRKHYREFGVRYNNILAREFGGIVIHSCGNIVHQVPTILEIENLRAVDLALPHNDPIALAHVAAGKTALTMRYWIQDWENRAMPDLEQYTDQIVEIFGTRGILLQMQTRTLSDAIELSARLSQKRWARI